MKFKQDWPYTKGRTFPLKIGVFSLHPHAGATFVSVLLAEYLANVIGYKTAVLENSSRGDLLSLQTQTKVIYEDGVFKLNKIIYQCYNPCQRGNSYLLHDIDCYISDLGSSYARAREHILDCDLTFLLFTMTPWYCNLASLVEKLKKDYGEKAKHCLIGNLILSDQKKQLYRQLHCRFLDFESNMFSPSPNAVQLFHQVLWSN